MLDRWVTFLAKKPLFYPYLKDWQAMIAQGGTEDQAKFLGDSFQQRIADIELENAAIEKENDKIKAKAGVITEHPKDAKPSDFDTYDEFCPGCTLELKVMSTEKANFYEDLFIRQLGTGVFEERGMPGLFSFRGWDLAVSDRPSRHTFLHCRKKAATSRRSARSIRSCMAWLTSHRRSTLRLICAAIRMRMAMSYLVLFRPCLDLPARSLTRKAAEGFNLPTILLQVRWPAASS